MTEFPVCGPREAVYRALRDRGFTMAGFGDKHWKRRDNIEVHIYGSGSKLRVFRDGQSVCDLPMRESLNTIDGMDRQSCK